jgi:preprotein translocase subunit YajC
MMLLFWLLPCRKANQKEKKKAEAMSLLHKGENGDDGDDGDSMIQG